MSAESDERLEIGHRIKALRQSQGLTLQQLAKVAAISPGYLSEVERGLSAISFEKLAPIADALKVRVDVLREGSRFHAASQPEIVIPAALSEAAEQLGLSYRATLRLLQGKESLIARRSSVKPHEWDVQEWIRFFERVREYLPDM